MNKFVLFFFISELTALAILRYVQGSNGLYSTLVPLRMLLNLRKLVVVLFVFFAAGEWASIMFNTPRVYLAWTAISV